MREENLLDREKEEHLKCPGLCFGSYLVCTPLCRAALFPASYVLSPFRQNCAELQRVAEKCAPIQYSLWCCGLPSYPSSPFIPQREITENMGTLKEQFPWQIWGVQCQQHSPTLFKVMAVSVLEKNTQR